jgi:hypothetical protein
MAIGRSRRPRGPTYARGTIRSLFENQELARQRTAFDNATRPPCLQVFYVAHSGSGSFISRVICASHHGGAGGTLVTPANVRLRWPHASRLTSCNLSIGTPLSLSLSLHFLFFFSAIGDRTAKLGPFSSFVTCRKVISFFSTPSFFLFFF